jgi:sulfite exporter TauE/SafE
MGAFWLGTLPMLTLWSTCSTWILARVGRFFPILRSLLLVSAGAVAVLRHTPAPAASASGSPHCDHAHHDRSHGTGVAPVEGVNVRPGAER